MDLSTYLAMAAVLVPLVTAVAAVVFQAVDLPTRYKPATTIVLGIALGVLLALTQNVRWVDGVWAGGLAALIASGVYSQGRERESYRG